MDDAQAIISLASALAHADGKISDREFSVLYKVAARYASAEGAREIIRRFAAVSDDEVTSQLHSALDYVAAQEGPGRLLFLLHAWDYASMDGVSEAERGLLTEIADRLEVSDNDRALVEYAMDPSMVPERAALESSSLRVVHLGRAGLPMPIRGVLSLAEVGSHRLLRIVETDDAISLTDEPAPLRSLIELEEGDRLIVAPYVFSDHDFAAFLAAARSEWQQADAMPSLASAAVLYRLGPLVAVEPRVQGLTVNGADLDIGQRRVLLPVDKLAFEGEALPVDSGLFSMLRVSSHQASVEASSDSIVRTEVLRQARGTGDGGAIDGLHIRGLRVEIGFATLLDDVSLDVERGELVAIVGPSGCGKTTLLEALSGRIRPTAGQAAVRMGLQMRPVPALLSRVAMVPQDEIVLPQLTVRENVDLACRLRLPLLDEKARAQVVDSCIAQVGLTARRDLIVGSPERRLLSGGQRRRVALALELVGKPDILLLDEPLSGLSSHDARNLMVLFLDLARRGRIVMVVIHQPSTEIFEYFDKVLVLDRGGKLAWYGPPRDAVRYFSDHAASTAGTSESAGHPDVILSTIEQRPARDRRRRRAHDVPRVYPPDYWQALFALRHPDRNTQPIHLPDEKPPRVNTRSRRVQLATVIKRHVLARVRNRSALVLSAIVAPFLGALLGTVLAYAPVAGDYRFGTNPNVLHLLFLAPIVTFFLGMTGSATEFITERRLIQHERTLGVPGTYFLISKLGLLMVWAVLETALFVIPVVLILDVPGPLEWLYVFSLLASGVGVAFGLFVSAVAPNIRVAHSFVPLAIIPQLLFGGLIPYDQMSEMVYLGAGRSSDAPLIGQVMPVRWAYEGLAVAFATDSPFVRDGLLEEHGWVQVDARKELIERFRAGDLTREQLELERATLDKRADELNDLRETLESRKVRHAVNAALSRAEAGDDNVFLAPERSRFGSVVSAPRVAVEVLLLQMLIFVGLAGVGLLLRTR